MALTVLDLFTAAIMVKLGPIRRWALPLYILLIINFIIS